MTVVRRRYAPPPPETFVQLVLRHYAAAAATAPAPGPTASASEEDLENEHFRLADAFLSAIEECGQAQSCHVPSLTFSLPPRGDEEPAMLPIAVAQAHADGSAGAHSDRTHSVDTDEDEDALRAHRRRTKGKHSRKSSSLSQSGTATRRSGGAAGRHARDVVSQSVATVWERVRALRHTAPGSGFHSPRLSPATPTDTALAPAPAVPPKDPMDEVAAAAARALRELSLAIRRARGVTAAAATPSASVDSTAAAVATARAGDHSSWGGFARIFFFGASLVPTSGINQPPSPRKYVARA